jgi:uncharacterized protein involved in exopolysaccharide biosynthesis
MEEGGLTFKSLILKLSETKKFLFSKWKIFLLYAILGALAGVLLSRFKTAKYTAKSTVIIGSSKGGLGGALRMAQSFGLGIGGGGDGATFSTENAPDIVKSNRIITNTLLTDVEIEGRKDKLANFYLDWFGVRENWVEKGKKHLIKFKFTGKEAYKLSYREDSIMSTLINKVTAKALEVKGDIKTGIVDISYSSINEKFTYYFSKELLNAVSHFYLDESVEKEKQTFKRMEDKTDSIYTEMITRERALARIKDQSNGNVMMQGMVTQMQLQRDIEILNVMYSLALKNLEMSKLTMTEKQPAFQIVDKPVLPLLRSGLSPIFAGVGLAILFVVLGVGYQLVRREVRKALS